jgi:hypothetical protein
MTRTMPMMMVMTIWTTNRSGNLATTLIDLANVNSEFFHAPDREPFASVCDTHREVLPVKGKMFRQWLAGLYFQETKGAIGGQAMQDALAVLSSLAVFKGTERHVHLRLAECDGTFFLDLANAQWQAIQISVDGWKLIDAPPVMFRVLHMQALPEPAVEWSISCARFEYCR